MNGCVVADTADVNSFVIGGTNAAGGCPSAECGSNRPAGNRPRITA